LTLRQSINPINSLPATALRLLFLLAALSLIARTAAAQSAYVPPVFRNTLEQQTQFDGKGTEVRLLTDEDFAPFSFRSASGAPTGLAVELALAACAEANLKCNVEALPYGRLLDALAKGQGDAVIAGPRPDAASLSAAVSTRPYFRIMARFAVPSASQIDSPAADQLAGKRIAVVQDTLHARFLAAYYPRARITPFASLAEAGAAMRGGTADALFGDNLQVIYWLTGEASGNCCRFLGGALSDFDYFSRNLSVMVRKDRPEIRQAFDYGLDMAQKTGATAKIITAYVPLSPW
jgi:polar amino acid transport system substrate-binding protein